MVAFSRVASLRILIFRWTTGPFHKLSGTWAKWNSIWRQVEVMKRFVHRGPRRHVPDTGVIHHCRFTLMGTVEVLPLMLISTSPKLCVLHQAWRPSLPRTHFRHSFFQTGRRRSMLRTGQLVTKLLVEVSATSISDD